MYIAACFETIYELFIEYSSELYRICRKVLDVDNPEKTDVPQAKMWITVWTVWKCMRLCTVLQGHEYSRMEVETARKVPNHGRLSETVEKPFIHAE